MGGFALIGLVVGIGAGWAGAIYWAERRDAARPYNGPLFYRDKATGAEYRLECQGWMHEDGREMAVLYEIKSGQKTIWPISSLGKEFAPVPLEEMLPAGFIVREGRVVRGSRPRH